jgi:hypothetical protein
MVGADPDVLPCNGGIWQDFVDQRDKDCDRAKVEQQVRPAAQVMKSVSMSLVTRFSGIPRHQIARALLMRPLCKPAGSKKCVRNPQEAAPYLRCALQAGFDGMREPRRLARQKMGMEIH